MKLIVISSPNDLDNEINNVKAMIDLGLEQFHLRKPNYTTVDFRRYLDKLGSSYWGNVVIHSKHELCMIYNLKGVHLSNKHKKMMWRTWLRIYKMRFSGHKIQVSIPFHKLKELKKPGNKKYQYVFLSPVFDSISKQGVRAAFSIEGLKEALANATSDVIALGGIDEDKIGLASELGFDGIAVLGGIWNSNNVIETFKRIQAKCESYS